MAIHFTDENFNQEVLSSNIPVLVDFYADWCGPCQMMAPILEEIEKEHPEVEFVKINIDDQQEMAEKYEVMSIPTLVFLDDNEEIIETFVGMKSKQDIEKALN